MKCIQELQKLLLITIICCNSIAGIAQVSSTITPLLLWYKKPAAIWEEALPLGNGKTGAMVYGGIKEERFQLNDHTLWSGYPTDGNNPNAAVNLPLLRQLVNEGKYAEAGALWKKNFQGPYSARYLPMADLYLRFSHSNNVPSEYYRELNLNTAIHTVKYTIDGVTFYRESLVSFPGKTLIANISASVKGALQFSILLNSKLKFTTVIKNNNEIILKGKAPKHVAQRESEAQQIVYDENGEGMTFEVQLKIKTDGHVSIVNNQLQVNKATTATVYLTNATSFNGFNKSPVTHGKNPAAEATGNMQQAFLKTFNNIKSEHIKDYQQLFNRVNFQLENNTEFNKYPTDVRLLNNTMNRNDLGLPVLYFHYGRYLLIASSREGNLPSNLQGIWNDHIQPPWGSNYTTNINVQMNYWLAENNNLSELHQPLFSWMEGLAKKGVVTAKTNYGINNGWVLHHNSDIWAKTSPAGGYDWDVRGLPKWSAWTMGGAWLATHLFEHYLYTGDKVFLKKYYPLIKGAAEFMINWLVKDTSGYWVTNPSTSPENVFLLNGRSYEISKASTMDMSIIRELFTACIASGSALQKDAAFVQELIDIKAKLYPYHIGKHAQLQEWFLDWDDPKDTHRHISHLFGLFPGKQISITSSNALAAAAIQSLTHRGDVSTGWSMAWKINWWARLQNGDKAASILLTGLNLIDPTNRLINKQSVDPNTPKDSAQISSTKITGGGVYANMFDAHPPFQIDGNFGASAGITEMLMQSHEGEIALLPALPSTWQNGMIEGIKARGNFTCSIFWANGKLSTAAITSNIGGRCRIKTFLPATVKFAKTIIPALLSKNKLLQPIEAIDYKINTTISIPQVPFKKGYIIEFDTEKGKTYTIETQLQ